MTTPPNPYAVALDAFLKSRHITQKDFGHVLGRRQSAISLYIKGTVLPLKSVAEKIEEVTMGEVPLSIWKLVALERAGIL